MKAATLQTCAELGSLVQQTTARHLGLAAIAVAAIIGLFLIYDVPHAGALAWILCGSFIPIVLWTRYRKPGLPLASLVALQTLAIFATPILTGNPTLAIYAESDVYSAGVEIFIFCAALAAGWRLAFASDTHNRQPRGYWGLSFISLENPSALCRSALVLTVASALFHFSLSIGALDPILAILPSGAFSVIRTLFDAAALAGALIGGYVIGNRLMPSGQRNLFWFCFIIFSAAKISTILLSNMIGVIVATSIGYFLGARRPPWFFLIITIGLLSFFNLSKFEMRAKYWNEYGYGSAIGALELPGYFAEWAGYSLDILANNRKISAEDEAEGQRLTDRLNNLQNLLFAQKAIQHNNLPTLNGATYTLIPPLLIPRVFWPNKPRSHEGQVMLNVHFGRQRLDATFITYIAWGLLAEAYGNFGAFWGSLFCGLALGLAAGGLERVMRPYPIASLEAFFFLILIIHFSLSFEMVASVWVTSVFQMVVALLICVFPFARRKSMPKPGDLA